MTPPVRRTSGSLLLRRFRRFTTSWAELRADCNVGALLR